MRTIEKNGNSFHLDFGLSGLPGYDIKAEKVINIPSVLSNPFFKDFNFLKMTKQLKGIRNNPNLQEALMPFTIDTGIEFDLSKFEFIQLSLAESLSQKHLLLVQPFQKNGKIKINVINIGLKDVKIEVNTLIATALIQKSDL